MTVHHGFELLREQYINELQTRATLYRHVKTDAELLSLQNDDENKVFGIAFRTPPSDSTGVPHILEHSVLCGSRKYPVKEPFVEILKGSLQTFLNAFTYPDKTCYPVASQNLQDFYNLVDIYLDAVFYPRITPHIFQQEGWHYELESDDRPLVYKGVVFNEMKGAYSSPDSLLAEYSQQSLFPDTTYGFDSGGNPDVIPLLSYETFKDFHRKYYHPSNARLFFYGDDDPLQRLALTDEYLKDFDAMDVDSTILLQQPFGEPRSMVYRFPSGVKEAGGLKGMVTINWLLCETRETEANMALHILRYILLGMPGSPLRKALIDSGLGEGITGVGLEDELRQMFFSVGLKGIDVQHAETVQDLIIETLSHLVKTGIDRDTVEAAVNTVEFRLRENNAGMYPRGLIYMLRCLTTWLNGGDPLVLLNFEPLLNRIKSRIESDHSYFESLVDRYFLSNSHRTTVLLKPDLHLDRQREKAEIEKLAAVKELMSTSKIRSVMEETRELITLQKTPDRPEDLAKIPMLTVSDLKRYNRSIPCAVYDRRELPVLYHDIPTNGIMYLDVGFNLRGLPADYISYVPLLGKIFTQIGTEKEDFVTLSKRISRRTGGVRAATFTSAMKDSNDTATWLFLRGKVMQDSVADLFEIMRDIITSVKLDNRERFIQIVREEKARQEQALIPRGHQMVNWRLRSHFNDADWVAEQLQGVSYLFFLRDLAKRVESDWQGILNDLTAMHQILVDRNTMLCNVTIDEEGWHKTETHCDDFLREIPEKTIRDIGLWPGRGEPFEGMTLPAQVNYVGKGADLYRFGYHFHGSLMVITKYLRTSYLWDRVRVQGGAYGAFCLFNRLSGVLTFLSYRDPNILTTLEAFDEAARYLRTIDLSGDELTKGIIGAIGEIDAHMLPDERGWTSMLRYLNGHTDDARQQMREEVLSTTVDDFRRFAEIMESVKNEGIITVLGSERAINEAVEKCGKPVQVFRVI